jgi:hypothetical protein
MTEQVSKILSKFLESELYDESAQALLDHLKEQPELEDIIHSFDEYGSCDVCDGKNEERKAFIAMLERELGGK